MKVLLSLNYSEQILRWPNVPVFHFNVWKENTKLAKRDEGKETESRNATGNNEVSKIIMGGGEKGEQTVRAENFNHIMKNSNAHIDIRV